MQTIVFGASGIVGGYIVEQLALAGETPYALSRTSRESQSVKWLAGDLSNPAGCALPPVSTIFCTAPAGLLAEALPSLYTASLKRVIVFTSTSVVTKADSEIASERESIGRWIEAENKLIATCERLGVGWTILRPTIIYAEGRDANVTRLARLIGKFGFLPLAGRGSGLRQPVHAQDLAIGALKAAATDASLNKIYALPGKDVITYREMVGRIFDGLQRPRRIISAPPFLWRAAFALAKPFFPNANVAMGNRMAKDMVFDASAAIRDFGWDPRSFRPRFG